MEKKRKIENSFFITAKKQTCPYCDQSFSVSKYDDHIRLCFDDLSSKCHRILSPAAPIADESNAFRKMMASAAPKQDITFQLGVCDGKILPMIEHIDGAPLTDNNISKTWSTNIALNAFEPDIVSCAYMDSRAAKKVKVHLCTNIPPFRSDAVGGGSGMGIYGPQTTSAHHSLVKSMLQKSVRRRRFGSACRLAIELARMSTSELLRRLPIICVEDSLLHPAVPVIVWLMMAESKGYIPPPWLVDICVHTVHRTPSQDQTHSAFPWSKDIDFLYHRCVVLCCVVCAA